MLRHQIPNSLRERIVELESSVETRYSRHRGVIDGREVDDNEIKIILRESDDSDRRREAWEASKTVGAEVADDVRELARLRNEAARSVGHRDWFALSLATDEMDENKLLDTLAAADRVTAEPFARWKSALDERLAERFAVTPPSSVLALRGSVLPGAASRGLRRSRPVLQGQGRGGARAADVRGRRIRGRGDTRPQRPVPASGKNQHAFCIDIDRSGDVRVRERHRQPQLDGRDAPRAGHGAYDLGFDDDLRWLLRDTLVTTRSVCSCSALWPATASGWSRCSRSRRTRRTSSKDDYVRRGQPSFSSSPAGFSS